MIVGAGKTELDPGLTCRELKVGNDGVSAWLDSIGSSDGVVVLKSADRANKIATVLVNYQSVFADSLTVDEDVSFQMAQLDGRQRDILHDCGKDNFLGRIQSIVLLHVDCGDLGSIESVELNADGINEFQKVPAILKAIGDGTMRLNLVHGIQQAGRHVVCDIASTLVGGIELLNEVTIEVSHDWGRSVLQW